MLQEQDFLRMNSQFFSFFFDCDNPTYDVSQQLSFQGIVGYNPQFIRIHLLHFSKIMNDDPGNQETCIELRINGKEGFCGTQHGNGMMQ